MFLKNIDYVHVMEYNNKCSTSKNKHLAFLEKSMSAITVQEFQGSKVRFEVREKERVWGCLTDMAKATGKNINDYLRLKSTQEFFQYLLIDIQGITETGIPVTVDFKGFEAILEINRGNFTGKEQGTWAIEEIVIDFAQWCSIPFRVWANRVIRNLIMNKQVDIFPKEIISDQTLNINSTTENMIETVVLQMKDIVEDPLALYRYAKTLDSLNTTLHRHQTKQEKIDLDSVRDFLNRYAEYSEDAKISVSEIYEAYRRFCKTMKYHPETMTRFGLTVADLFVKRRTAKGMVYIGVRLNY